MTTYLTSIYIYLGKIYNCILLDRIGINKWSTSTRNNYILHLGTHKSCARLPNGIDTVLVGTVYIIVTEYNVCHSTCTHKTPLRKIIEEAFYVNVVVFSRVLP